VPRPSTLTPAQLATIRSMGRDGVRQVDIGAAVGLTGARVSQILAGRGKRASRTSATAARDQAIRAAVWRANSAGERAPVAELAQTH
jgi:hypothetical protein